MKKLLMLALASAMAFGMSVCAFAAHHPLSKGSLIGEIIYPGDTIEFKSDSLNPETICWYGWGLGDDDYVEEPGISFTQNASYPYTVLAPTDPVLTGLGFPAVGAGYWIAIDDDLYENFYGDLFREYVDFIWVAAPPATGEASYTEQEQDFWHEDVLTKALETKADAKTGEKIANIKIADCYDSVPVGVMDTLRIKNDLTVIFEYKGEKITLDLSKLPKSEANRAFYPIEYLIEIASK